MQEEIEGKKRNNIGRLDVKEEKDEVEVGIARGEERKGNRTWVGYSKMKIGEQWSKRDEGEVVLRDGKETVRRI